MPPTTERNSNENEAAAAGDNRGEEQRREEQGQGNNTNFCCKLWRKRPKITIGFIPIPLATCYIILTAVNVWIYIMMRRITVSTEKFEAVPCYIIALQVGDKHFILFFIFWN